MKNTNKQEKRSQVDELLGDFFIFKSQFLSFGLFWKEDYGAFPLVDVMLGGRNLCLG